MDMETWGQYGLLGLIVIALAGYILRIEAVHAKKEKEWQQTVEDASKDQANAIKESASLQATTIREIIQRQNDMMNRIADKMDERQNETNDIISKHISILEAIKYLLERR